jgi:flagellar hook-length control protein FliK
MPELMITPTPTQLPGTTGNANALSQSEAMGRSGDSAKADAESSEAPPFASVLKSHMDKKPTASEAVDSAAGTAAAAQAEVSATTVAIDLSALLPLLGINPGSATKAAVEPTTVAVQTVAIPEVSLLPALPALPALPVLAGQQPTVAALPSAETPAGATPTLAVALDAGSRKLQAEPGREAPASVTAAKAEPLAQKPGKITPDAAINADGGPKGSEAVPMETAASGDFRALMDRAAAMAPGVASATSHASSAPGLRIDTPLGQSGWHEEMGQKLTWMVSNNRQQADLVLTPPQLGRVEVSLTMNGDQATAIFTSGNPAVREALEASLQRLREVLADAGVSLGQTQVGSESPSQSSRQEERGFGTDQGVRYAATVALPGSSTTARGGTGRGMVDVFA